MNAVTLFRSPILTALASLTIFHGVIGPLYATTAVAPGPHRDVRIERSAQGDATITITGTTPHFWSQPIKAPVEETMLSFEYFSTSGIDSLAVRFKNEDGEMVFANSAPVPLAETWQPFSIELEQRPAGETRFHFSLKGKPGEGLQIRNFFLRKATPQEIAKRRDRERILSSRQADSDAFLQYLRDWYPNMIESVKAMEDHIIISGTAGGAVQLVEIPAHVASHGSSPYPAIKIEKAEEFSVKVPRIEPKSQRDRVFSRWRLETSDRKIASLAKWPTDIGFAPALPEIATKSQKGIGGVPNIASDDHPLFELGVDHATVNIVLTSLLSPAKTGDGVPWVFEGTTYYLNENFLRDKDATIKRLRENDIVLTCILLVGNQRNSRMKHPESEPRGIFAMPDLATEAGAKYYRAAISFITERYSHPGRRISNWVLHNEIDQHGTWTNMGDQPLPRYLETYARSARITYLSARLHDPNARVFISLTHHWAKPSIGRGAFVVRDLIDLWSELSESEGESEFEWGVAYHPYPVNLRNPDTWDDEVTFDFDTPYITSKNIEVLPAYLGPDRPILLSEQGFNTPTLSVADQERQVAGILYTFRKIRKLPSIEAYHLHRYQDMPDREGNLRFGLLDENNNRKLAWDAYVDLGTPAEGKHDAIADKFFASTENRRLPQLKPNIVLIVADDLGYSDTTPYLDPSENFYETPALAELAKRGMKFTNAYSASPLCSPTRASILTGQYPGRVRLTTPAAHLPKVVLDPVVPETASPSKHAIEPQTRTRFPNAYVTLAERLKDLEYRTAFVGKWHLGRPPYIPDNQGFDFVIGGRSHPGPPGGFFAPWTSDMIPSAPEGSHIDDVITGATIEWMEEQALADEPFFLNLWYYSVHAPLEAKPELVEKYHSKARSLSQDAPRANPVMAAMIETLDTNVGRITAALDRLKLTNETLIIFTSDNGGNEYNFVDGIIATSNHPLRNGKANINEGGHRVPFLASWPGKIEAGSTNPGLVSSIDIFPTVLDAVSQSPAPEQPVDGLSLLPTLLGKAEIDPNREIFCHFPHSPPATGTITGTSVRRGPWKLTRFWADGPGQSDRLRLVNLDRDPGESEDLCLEHPELTRTLNQSISAHLEETASLVPRPNPNYLPTAHGWIARKDAVIKRVDDALLIESSGNDPILMTRDFPRTAGQITIEVKMESPRADDPPVVYWGTKKQKRYHRDRSVPMTRVAPGLYRLDIDLEEEILDSLRFDPARRPGTIKLDSFRLIHWKSEGAGKTQRYWDF